MLRSRKQQQQSTNGCSLSSHAIRHSNGGDTGDDADDLRGGLLRQHHHHSASSSKKSITIIPKSLIGTLIVASVLFVLLVFSGSLSNNSDDSIGGGVVGSISSDEVVLDASSSGKMDDSTKNNNKQLRNAAAQDNNNNNDKYKNTSSKSTTTGITTHDDIGTTSPTTGATLHIIFSTDCGTFQHWQSYLFFHRAYTIHQPGYITRIASGCTEEQLHYEKLWHETRISNVMSTRYRIHFTPHFSGVKDEITGEVMGDYKFFNKPFGLKHFLEHDELLGFKNNEKEGDSNHDNNPMKHPNDIIILCDPDFALLRPITDDFSNPRETLVGPRRRAYFDALSSHIVSHGHPYAQTYGLGTQWRKFNIDTITGMTNSPAKDVNQQDGGIFYPAGPPYIGTASDMYKIAVSWSEFAPRVYKEYPHLLAEMYAYCIAAAHIQLPHTLIDSLMISSAGVGGEGWKYIQSIPTSETCSFASNPDHTVRPIPTLLHYCQRYIVDDESTNSHYFWSKRKIPHGIFTCDHPLLMEPPMDLWLGSEGVVDHHPTEKEKMNAFMVCALTKFTNDAMIFFKDHHCEGDNGGGGGGGNRERVELSLMKMK